MTTNSNSARAPELEPEPTFTSWLSFNRWRSDPIGDLARDAYTDPLWPHACHYKQFRVYLEGRHARDAVLESLNAAWNEFELYFGGPSELSKHTHVCGVTGGMFGRLPGPTTKVHLA